MLEKTEGTIKNGKSRKTGNIGNTRHKMCWTHSINDDQCLLACGNIVIFSRKSCSPMLLIFIPSIIISPLDASTNLNSANAMDDFPAPVLPTMPIYKVEYRNEWRLFPYIIFKKPRSCIKKCWFTVTTKCISILISNMRKTTFLMQIKIC